MSRKIYRICPACKGRIFDPPTTDLSTHYKRRIQVVKGKTYHIGCAGGLPATAQ